MAGTPLVVVAGLTTMEALVREHDLGAVAAGAEPRRTSRLRSRAVLDGLQPEMGRTLAPDRDRAGLAEDATSSAGLPASDGLPRARRASPWPGSRPSLGVSDGERSDPRYRDATLGPCPGSDGSSSEPGSSGDWGGEIRRQEIFARLAARTGASVADGWPAFRRAVLGGRLRRAMRSRRPAPAARRRSDRSLRRSRRRRPGSTGCRVTSIRPRWRSTTTACSRRRRLASSCPRHGSRSSTRRRARNEALFRWLVVPTASFARLIGLDMDRVIVGGNGTVTSRVRPGPWPDVPTIGTASGRGAGRGLETLVEAARGCSGVDPGPAACSSGWRRPAGPARPTSSDLRASVEGDALDPHRVGAIRAGSARPSARRPSSRSRVRPASTATSPCRSRLFDSMAAGRPTRRHAAPRDGGGREAVRHRASSRRATIADSLAEAFALLLNDTPPGAARSAPRARAAAEAHFDWTVVGERIADEVLRRET